LAGALARPRRLFIGVGVALLAAAVAYVAVGKTFMPTMDEGSVVIQLAKLPSINLERSLALDTAIQKAILDTVPEVAEAVSRTGTDEIGLDPMGLNETSRSRCGPPRC
jgi:cobalt-zinc-cadmium resistance protein CzcA